MHNNDSQFQVEVTFFTIAIHSPLCSGGKLFSFDCLVEVAQTNGYQIVKVWREKRDPQQKFEALLGVIAGHFMVLTNVQALNQGQGSHNLEHRNLQHWIAVDGHAGLVIDSLARTLGPQKLAFESLKRSTREGIVRVFEVTRV